MKKYIRLECDTCRRTIDRLVDNSRFTPDRCVITLNCRGKLSPVEYRSNREITSTPEVGVVDWYPRGQSKDTVYELEAEVLVDTSTGTKQQLVLAVKLATAPLVTDTAMLVLETKNDTPKEYKQYIFRRASEFSTLAGVEDAVTQKTLKFTAWGSDPDVVEVYLNGVKLEQGLGPQDYQLDDGTPTSSVPSNTVKFNTPVLPVGTYQVDVIVSKMQPSIVESLIFNRNKDDPNRINTGAWENVSHIQIFSSTSSAWENYYLFTFDVENNVQLNKDTILFPSASTPVITIGSGPTAPYADTAFLLARSPYTKLDRYSNIFIPLSSLDSNKDYLKYHNVEGQLRLEVTQTSLETFFPAARIMKFNLEPTIKTRIAGVDEQILVEGKIVVGPDV